MIYDTLNENDYKEVFEHCVTTLRKLNILISSSWYILPVKNKSRVTEDFLKMEDLKL